MSIDFETSILSEASAEIDSFKASIAADVTQIAQLTAQIAANTDSADLANLKAKVDALDAKLSNPVPAPTADTTTDSSVTSPAPTGVAPAPTGIAPSATGTANS